MSEAPLLSPSHLGKMCRLSARLYFAPLVGAWRGAVQETRLAHAQWDEALAERRGGGKRAHKGADVATCATDPSPHRSRR